MNNKIDADLVQFLESMVNLDALDRMTNDLGNELQHSQVVMNQIKGMIDALPSKVENINSEPESNGRNEDLSNFLTAGTPQLMMPDMDNSLDVDNVDDVVATLRSYVEDLKKNFTAFQPSTHKTIQKKQLESFELEQYASNLDQLCKRLSNLKLSKQSEVNSRNAELEAKLSVLCDDVKMFTKMIQAKTAMSEAGKNWSQTQQTTNALDYDKLFNRMLADINSLSYLLLSNN